MSISTLTNWWGRTYPRFLYPARATPKPDLSGPDNYVADLVVLARSSRLCFEAARECGQLTDLDPDASVAGNPPEGFEWCGDRVRPTDVGEWGAA